MRGKLLNIAFSINRKPQVTIEITEGALGEIEPLRDMDLDITLKKHREKRSLDANAYAWVLMDKLATATGQPKTEIYRRAVRDVGGNTETYCGLAPAVEKLCEVWARRGLGWQAETFPSKLDGCLNVILYYGSSTFDSAQMSRLIDGLVQDCQALNIETLPPERLAAMMEEWGGKEKLNGSRKNFRGA